MKTLILRIAEAPAAGGDYPLHACVESATERWWEAPAASSSIPASLDVPNPPLNFETQQALTAAEIPALLAAVTDGPALEAIGTYLYQLLARGDVGTLWRTMREAATANDPLRVLLDVQPRALRVLPWELMCEPPEWLCRSNTHRVCRGRVDFGAKTELDEWPVRMLLVVGCDPAETKLKWELELYAIEDAIRPLRFPIDLEVLAQPTRQKLREVIEQFRPHVFHFVGHGHDGAIDDAEAAIMPRAALELWNGNEGGYVDWTVSDIVEDFKGRHAPRFVVLNACRTTQAASPGSIWSVAQAFLQCGAVAVLGMQGDIEGEAAALISAHLYDAIVKGMPLDLALVDARQSLTTYPKFKATRDWSLPSLMLSVTPEQAISLRRGPRPERLLELDLDDAFTKVRDLVDRRAERRTVRRHTDCTLALPGGAVAGAPPPPAANAANDPPRHVLFVTGDEETGKTALTIASLQALALKGHDVYYRDASGGASLDFLGILRLIRDGDETSTSLIHQKLPAPPFAAFNALLNEVLDPAWNGVRTPPEQFAGKEVDDKGHPIRAGEQNLVKLVFESFLAALREASKDRSIIIALDHLAGRPGDTFPAQFQQYVRPKLVNEIVLGRVPNVRLVVCGTDNDLTKLGLAGMAGTVAVDVRDFSPNDFFALATEFCVLNNIGRTASKRVVKAFAEEVQELKVPFKPAYLRVVHSALAALKR